MTAYRYSRCFFVFIKLKKKKKKKKKKKIQTRKLLNVDVGIFHLLTEMQTFSIHNF